jgi:nucleoside-diphosphate-sugar epimerase
LNNVTNFTDLLNKIKNQLLIYASSASVYGNGLPGQKHTESVEKFIPVNNYDVTKYVLDLHAETALLQGQKVIGMRFGTVNGYSLNLRTDVMINAMYETAVRSGTIQVTNSHISRAILGIEDLCRAIKVCIENPIPGIYNLSSFNHTVSEIASTVAEFLDVRLVDNGLTGNAYDFSLDTSLFEKTFDFQFRETPYSILQGLKANYANARTQRRDQYVYYDYSESNSIE